MNSHRAKATPLVSVVLFVGVSLILTLAAYVAAYALLVTVNDGLKSPGFEYGEAAAEYRFGGRAAEIVFSPVHALDRRLRPTVWTFEPPLIQRVEP